MTTSTNLFDYVIQGTAADRPVTPNNYPTAIVFYYATDTNVPSVWANGAWHTIPAGAGIGLTDGDKGDIVVASSGASWTFDTGVVTAFAKTFLDDANAAAVRTTLGLATVASSGSAADLTGNLAVARLNSGTSASSSTFWRGDGTWAAAGAGTVTTTGSPASGNLAKFSGATSIVNGDLSGDVTTSGTLAATIANSAVTLAKIANAAASSKLVGSGASGSGAAYSEITLGTGLAMTGTTLSATATATTPFGFSPPLASAFTAFTGDAGTCTLTDDTDVGLVLTASTAVNTAILRGGYKALPAVGTDFSVVIKVVLNCQYGTQHCWGGLTMYESATGKSHNFFIPSDTASEPFHLRRQTIAGTFTSEVTVGFNYTLAAWFKMDRVGTTLGFYTSSDGKNWHNVQSIAQTTFLTTAPDRIGPSMLLSNATLKPIVSIPYWAQTGF